MPVLPEDESSRTLSFVSLPIWIASRKMNQPARSLMEPPGLCHSA